MTDFRQNPHFVAALMANYLDEYLLNRKQNSWIFRHEDYPITPDGYFWLMEAVLKAMKVLTTDLEKTLGDSYDVKFDRITEPLLGELIRKKGKDDKFYKIYRIVADEHFAPGIHWIPIVTFIIFNAELAHKAIRWAEENEETYNDSHKLVAQIIRCVSRYFDENLMQWINEQHDDWASLVIFSKSKADNNNRNNNVNHDFRRVKQYVKSAALAVAIGGLFLLSIKATVQ